MAVAVLLWRGKEQVWEKAHTASPGSPLPGCVLGAMHPGVSWVQGSWQWLRLVAAWAAMGPM